MLLLSARTLGQAPYAAFIESQGLTVPELLHFFPTLAPPAERLLAVLPPLPPRYYSVASSQLHKADRLSIAFSVHSHVTTSGIVREGLCTNWLEHLLSPLLAPRVSSSALPSSSPSLSCTTTSTLPSNSDPGPLHIHVSHVAPVPMFLRPTKEFFLPGSSSCPCVLIGPGTGVAPFMGFLQHRAEQAKRAKAASRAAVSGCWRGGFDIEGDIDGKDWWGSKFILVGCVAWLSTCMLLDACRAGVQTILRVWQEWESYACIEETCATACYVQWHEL